MCIQLHLPIYITIHHDLSGPADSCQHHQGQKTDMNDIINTNTYHTLYTSIHNNKLSKKQQFFLYSMLDLKKQKEKYCCSRIVSGFQEFQGFLTYYAKTESISEKRAAALIYNACHLTVEEHSLKYLKSLFKEYQLTPQTFARVLGFDRRRFERVWYGSRPVFKDLVLFLCMFLEFDIEKSRHALNECGFGLNSCFPDFIFEKHIKDENFCLQDYVSEAIAVMENENMLREKAGESQVELSDMYHKEHFYPLFSVSDYATGDGYDYKSAPDILFDE